MASPAATLHSETLDRILRDYQAVAARLPDAAVPREARAHALRELSRYGWPKARDEQWRYTNLRAFEAVPAFAPAVLAQAPELAPELALALPPALPGFQGLLYVAGVPKAGPTAIAATWIAAPTASHTAGPDWPAEQRFGLLCDMFASDVAALRINGTAAIEVLFLTSTTAAGAACYPRLQVALE